MPDEGGRHAGRPVDLRFEREDDQDAVGERAQGAHASAAPRPQLRRDVVHDRDAEPPHRAGHPEVEVREVDRHEHVGPLGSRGVHEPPVQRVRSRQHAKRLDQPRHRDAPIVAHERGAGRLQPLAAEAAYLQAGIQSAQRVHEGAGIQVARRLAAGDEHARHLVPSTRRGSRAACGVLAREVGRRHVKVREPDHLDATDTRPPQLIDERGRVADQHHRWIMARGDRDVTPPFCLNGQPRRTEGARSQTGSRMSTRWKAGFVVSVVDRRDRRRCKPTACRRGGARARRAAPSTPRASSSTPAGGGTGRRPSASRGWGWRDSPR